MNIEFVSDKYNQENIELFRKRNAANLFLGPIGVSLSDDNFASPNYDDLTPEDQIIWFKALHYLRWKYHNQKLSRCIKDKIKNAINFIRNKLANCNRWLVRSAAKMIGMSSSALDEFATGECLLKCIDAFDPWRGYMFSTYAVTSLRRILLRKSSKSTLRLQNATQINNNIETNDVRRLDQIDEYKILHRIMQEELNERERQIIELRYGFITGEALTLREVGIMLGITRERVRQLQATILLKLKEVIDDCPLYKH